MARFPGLWCGTACGTPLSLLAEGCAPILCSGGRAGGERGESGGRKLRLTVNFVVAGVVRNFGASGLTFRSVGNPNPSKYREQETFEGSSITRVCNVCVWMWIAYRGTAWYGGLDVARVYMSGGSCDFVNI